MVIVERATAATYALLAPGWGMPRFGSCWNDVCGDSRPGHLDRSLACRRTRGILAVRCTCRWWRHEQDLGLAHHSHLSMLTPPFELAFCARRIESCVSHFWARS